MRVRFVDAALAGLLWSATCLGLAAQGGDASAGKTKAQTCAPCHGGDGNSTNPLFPSLAKQAPLYIYYQLLQFREQRRVDEQMSPFAAKLTDADMKDLAAYFSAQEALGTGRPPDEGAAHAGKAIVARNHCDSCHTASFGGQDHIPRIAGLQYDYLVKQLRGFKTGERPDIDGAMTSAAQPLSDQDITDVSAYLAVLR